MPQNYGPLYPEGAHYWDEVAPDYVLLAFQTRTISPCWGGWYPYTQGDEGLLGFALALDHNWGRLIHGVEDGMDSQISRIPPSTTSIPK